MDNNSLWDKLNEHWGHNVRITRYGDADSPADVCLECDGCREIILDAELYTLCAKDNEERGNDGGSV